MAAAAAAATTATVQQAQHASYYRTHNQPESCCICCSCGRFLSGTTCGFRATPAGACTVLDDAVVWVYDGTAVERAAVGSLNGVVAPPIPTEATFGRPGSTGSFEAFWPHPTVVCA